VSSAYRALVDLSTPAPISLRPGIDTPSLKAAWKHLQRLPIPPKMRELRWRLWHDRLIQLRETHNKRITWPECGLAHKGGSLFANCDIAQGSWALLTRPLLAQPALTSLHQLQGWWASDWYSDIAESPTEPPALVAELVCSTIRFCIWAEFAKASKSGSPFSVSSIQSRFLEKMALKKSHPQGQRTLQKSSSLLHTLFYIQRHDLNLLTQSRLAQ
jgi:hypothetical protein